MIQVKIVGFNLIKLLVIVFVKLKETVRQIASNFLRSDVKRDILISTTAVGNRLPFLS